MPTNITSILDSRGRVLPRELKDEPLMCHDGALDVPVPARGGVNMLLTQYEIQSSLRNCLLLSLVEADLQDHGQDVT